MNEESRPEAALENSAVAAGSRFKSTGRVSSCVEIDLRRARDDVQNYLRHALDGIAPGDTLKILVDRQSDPSALYATRLVGVHIQLTADSVWTRRVWDAVAADVIA